MSLVVAASAASNQIAITVQSSCGPPTISSSTGGRGMHFASHLSSSLETTGVGNAASARIVRLASVLSVCKIDRCCRAKPSTLRTTVNGKLRQEPTRVLFVLGLFWQLPNVEHFRYFCVDSNLPSTFSLTLYTLYLEGLSSRYLRMAKTLRARWLLLVEK